MTFPAGEFSESMLYGRYVARTAAITFDAGTTGSIAQHTLFTVTGQVQAVVVAYCSDDVTGGGGATISVGTANVVDGLQPVTGFDALDTGMIWAGNNTPSECEAETGNRGAFVAADITCDILNATFTGGVVQWFCFWTPLSADATVVTT